MPSLSGYEGYATPTLMRAARGAYAQAIRASLAAAGFEDLPKNGAFILAGVGDRRGPADDLPEGLGVTKQAVSQTIDALVNRGYLERQSDPDDRRRNLLELTERGQQALDAVITGVDEIDDQLAEEISPQEYDATRKTLAAMARIKVTRLGSGTSRRRPRSMLQRVSPIFPVRDLAAALDQYRGLGFEVTADDSGHDYGFADRDGVSLHLTAADGPSFGHCYLYVRDADALYNEWSRPGAGGVTRQPEPTPYKLKEGSHTDPDGNLIRFGSWLADA
jgi:DNA-binding MarR family transcriptional regulator/catechol 2,3-dioxygenase-like lactoylglutathione lyase family enzyme